MEAKFRTISFCWILQSDLHLDHSIRSLQSLNVFKKLYMIETLHSMLLTNLFVLFPHLFAKLKFWFLSFDYHYSY